jgi:tetratricopeptide (TPR) repeat protein
MLDAEEYLHLAIHATQNQQHHAALEYLHKSLEINPDNGRALYLLAAEHAELGLYDRAIQGMTAALDLEPGLELARYQLALLYMQQGNAEACKEIWEFLSEHASGDALRFVAQGLNIIEENYSSGMALIEKAVDTESTNEFLKTSINNIRNNLNEQTAALDKSATKSSSETTHDLFLGAYLGSTITKDDD